MQQTTNTNQTIAGNQNADAGPTATTGPTPQPYRTPLRSQNVSDWRNRTPYSGQGQSQGHHSHHPSRGQNWSSAGARQYQMNEYYAGVSGDTEYVRESMKATEEGRRLYFGNLDYNVIPEDIALWLEGAGYEMYEYNLDFYS